MLKIFYDKGKFPWMNGDDMKQANENMLVRCPLNEDTWEEYETCEYAFFPGCQLAASEPELVIKVYDSLLLHFPDTAMFLQCCGISGEWAGENISDNLSDIHQKWEALGKPTLIMACTTCMKHFAKELPEIPTMSLYEMLVKLNMVEDYSSEDYSYFTLSQEHEKSTEDAVRELTSKIGIKLHTLDESQFPMLTHCINCRDMLKNDGLDSVHILELIYGKTEDCEQGCSSCSSCGGCTSDHTDRYDNRVQLKELMEELFWEEF